MHPETDALVTDHYLDSLLAAGDRHAGDAPSDASLPPGLRDAARVLQRSLVRVHPSFRFEERLATRLSALAAAQAEPAVAAGGGSAAPVSIASRMGRLAATDPLLDAIVRGDLDPADAEAVERATPGGVDRRPLLVGGAITSAALSIVGVAIVAWRASRPGPRSSNRAMARAARTARARRSAAALAGGIGSLGGPA